MQEQLYYIVLLNVFHDTTVWFGKNHQTNEFTWSIELKDSGYFTSFDEAFESAQKEGQEVLGAIATFKVISFTRDELDAFGIQLDTIYM